MLNILVPVDGSENALLATGHAAELAARRGDAKVHLINVQPKLNRHAARFVSRRTLAEASDAAGRERLAGAERLLRSAGINYKSEVLSGDPALTAARYAQENQISQIVVGTARKTTLLRFLSGSFTNDLLERANVPVEVVAGGRPGALARIGVPAGLGLGLTTMLLVAD